MIDVNQILDNLKHVLGIKNDSELSEKLGKSKNIVAIWRGRGTMDYRAVIEYALLHGVDLNYLFSKKNQSPHKVDSFEEFIFFNLKRTIFKKSFIKKFDANLQFLFKVIKENIDSISFQKENAKDVLLQLIKEYKINSILDSNVKKENVIKFIEENLSNIECYVFLKNFEKFEMM